MFPSDPDDRRRFMSGVAAIFIGCSVVLFAVAGPLDQVRLSSVRATGISSSRPAPVDTSTTFTPGTVARPVAPVVPSSPTADSSGPKRAKPSVESDMARSIFEMINQERRARGLTELTWSADLTVPATSWTAHMAATGDLVHQSMTGLEAGRTPALGMVGENILQAGRTDDSFDLHSLWMNSTGHRENILRPDFDRVGIAVHCDGNEVWATEDFGAKYGLGLLTVDSGSDVAAVFARAASTSGSGLSCSARS